MVNPKVLKVFKMIDTDEDKKISRSEFERGLTKVPKGLQHFLQFSQIDTNGNGFIEAEEINASEVIRLLVNTQQFSRLTLK